MQKTGENIAGSKIERKQRTECCNLQHLALSDAVIYSILRCQMARTRVNTTVLVPESR